MTNEQQCEEKCAKKQSAIDDNNLKLLNNEKMDVNNKNVSHLKNHRQCAGGEKIKLSKDQNDKVKKQKNSRNKILRESPDWFNVKNNFKSYETTENDKFKYSKSIDASADEILNLKKQTSKYDIYIEEFNKRKMEFQRDSSDFQRRISTAEESVQRANARSKSAKNTNDKDLGLSDVS